MSIFILVLRCRTKFGGVGQIDHVRWQQRACERKAHHLLRVTAVPFGAMDHATGDKIIQLPHRLPQPGRACATPIPHLYWGETRVGQVMRGTVQHRGHEHQDVHTGDDHGGLHRLSSLLVPGQDLHGENMFVFGAHGGHVLHGQFTRASEDGIVVHQFGENMVGEIPFHCLGLSVVHGPLGDVQGDVVSSNRGFQQQTNLYQRSSG